MSLAPRYNEIVCIGAGLSGIGLGIQLRRKFGFTDIYFYDRNNGPSGTWESNRYPGCACDVPAVYYSFSFETKPDWTTLFPFNTEIRQYINGLIDKYDLRNRMSFRTECESAKWDETRKIWAVCLRDIESGQQYIHECRMLFAAVGVLVNPSYPNIPGIDSFQGHIFHTARWHEDVDLTGKDVVLLGNGSSGIQTVPQLAQIAKTLTQIIRTPHWLLPRENPAVPLHVQRAYAGFPVLQHIIRAILFVYSESNWLMFFMNKVGAAQRKHFEAVSRKFVQTVAPAKYHDMLIPDWPISCKRRVFDNDHLYLKSLHSSNVELTNAPIIEVLMDGVRTTQKVYPADAIVLATGFNTNTSMSSIHIEGRDGMILNDYWKELGGPGAYNNTAVHGFPNFMFIYGPNSTTGHNSVLFTIESHIRYSLKIIEPVIKGEALTYEVDEKAERDYVKSVQVASQDKVWNTCQNWYVTDGWNGTLYPWSQVHFWWKSHFPVWKHWTYTYGRHYMKRQRTKRAYRLLFFMLIIILGGSYRFGYVRHMSMRVIGNLKAVDVMNVFHRIRSSIYH